MGNMILLKWGSAYHYFKNHKVVTHVTVLFFIIIIEMKSQQSFSLTNPPKKHRHKLAMLFLLEIKAVQT